MTCVPVSGSMRVLSSSRLVVQLFDAPDHGEGAVDLHAVSLERSQYPLAVVGQEGDATRLGAAQPERDGDPAGRQRDEFRDRQLVVAGFPGRYDPAADRGAAEPDAPVEELQPDERAAGDDVPGHDAAPEELAQLSVGCVDDPCVGRRKPGPHDDTRGAQQDEHDDHDGDEWHPASRVDWRPPAWAAAWRAVVPKCSPRRQGWQPCATGQRGRAWQVPATSRAGSACLSRPWYFRM